jgi:hypothetical protein
MRWGPTVMTEPRLLGLNGPSANRLFWLSRCRSAVAFRRQCQLAVVTRSSPASLEVTDRNGPSVVAPLASSECL